MHEALKNAMYVTSNIKNVKMQKMCKKHNFENSDVGWNEGLGFRGSLRMSIFLNFEFLKINKRKKNLFSLP